MKIQTRLLLSILPAIIASNLLIAGFISYKWVTETEENFREKVRSSLTLGKEIIDSQELSKNELGESSFHSEEILSYLRLQETNLSFDNISLFENSQEQQSLSLEEIKTKEGDLLLRGKLPIQLDDKAQYILALDVPKSILSKKLQEGLLLIVSSTLGAILLATVLLLIISKKISSPVQKLGRSALAIAAGKYGEQISVKGPKEISDLSNTLNTMSECLLENINRLKENALIRERIYGEYECSRMLQHLMLQKKAKECGSDLVSIEAFSIYSDEPKGIYLDFPVTKEHLQLYLVEAKERGFSGIYELITESKTLLPHRRKRFPFLEMTLTKEHITYNAHSSIDPIFFSFKKRELLDNPTKLSTGDLFFLYNQELLKLYPKEALSAMIARVAKIFAEEGLETLSNMIKKEVQYRVRKKDFEEDIHFLSFQVL